MWKNTSLNFITSFWSRKRTSYSLNSLIILKVHVGLEIFVEFWVNDYYIWFRYHFNLPPNFLYIYKLRYNLSKDNQSIYPCSFIYEIIQYIGWNISFSFNNSNKSKNNKKSETSWALKPLQSLEMQEKWVESLWKTSSRLKIKACFYLSYSL